MNVRLCRGVLRPLVCGAGLLMAAVPAPALALAQLLDSTTPLAPPKDVDEANDTKIRELMRAGVTEYRKKNLEGARQAFAKAWETARRPVVAAALADVEMKLARYRDAAEHWDYYLQTKPADQAEAVARLDECRLHVTAVRVELEPAGAELEVDGNRVPTGGSGGTIWLEPGPHTLTARSEGRASATQRVDATAGQEVAVRLSVSSAPAPTPAPTSAFRVLPPPPVVATATPPSAPSDAPSGGIRPRTVVAIGGTTLTLVGAGLGVWFVVQRSNADNEREQILNGLDAQFPDYAQTHNVCVDRPDRPAACNDVFAKSREADRAGNWAIGSFVGAGVFGAATIATYLLWPASEKRAAANGLIVAPLVGRGAHGMQLRMSF